MIKYAVLGSGSTANSYIIQFDGTKKSAVENSLSENICSEKITIVIDNGFSLKEFSRRAAELDYNINDIDFIFLTHDHSDHIKGVANLSSKYRIPVVMGKNTNLKSEYSDKIYESLIVEGGREYSFNNLKFSVFRTFHDSDGSVGYSFSLFGTVITIITDTGTISDEMEKHAADSDILFLEANYCPDMLERGPYPVFLKRRIASELGHLSNEDAVDFLGKLNENDNRKRKIYLCHLSDKNNCPDKLDSVIKESFGENPDIDYRICRKGETVEGHPVKVN